MKKWLDWAMLAGRAVAGGKRLCRTVGMLGVALMAGWLPAHAQSGATSALASVSLDGSGNELSYGAYIDSRRRIKCLYGYAAEKTGDHAAAIRIFEDCIARWEDVYSMIWLAMMYENGVGVPRDLGKAAELMRRGALSPESAGYATLMRYH